jgi:hypothetical protein
MKPLDLFPCEAPRDARIPIQGRITLRNQTAALDPSDIPRLIELGSLEGNDDPDQAQRIGTHGFPPPSFV